MQEQTWVSTIASTSGHRTTLTDAGLGFRHSSPDAGSKPSSWKTTKTKTRTAVRYTRAPRKLPCRIADTLDSPTIRTRPERRGPIAICDRNVRECVRRGVGSRKIPDVSRLCSRPRPRVRQIIQRLGMGVGISSSIPILSSKTKDVRSIVSTPRSS